MRRWHSPREQAVMFRRWRAEMVDHGYDWRSPPTDQNACHCARGIGSMCKRAANSSGSFIVRAARANTLRAALRYEVKRTATRPRHQILLFAVGS